MPKLGFFFHLLQTFYTSRLRANGGFSDGTHCLSFSWKDSLFHVYCDQFNTSMRFSRGQMESGVFILFFPVRWTTWFGDKFSFKIWMKQTFLIGPCGNRKHIHKNADKTLNKRSLFVTVDSLLWFHATPSSMINPVNVKSSQERLKSHETTELNGQWPLDFCSKPGRKTGEMAHGVSETLNPRIYLQFFDICFAESQFRVQLILIFLVSFACFVHLWCFFKGPIF